MRLLTRSDFDGLACAVILKEIGVIDDWLFVHPKDLQDGAVAVTKDDLLANVPYVKGCGMWFDHHSSETERVGDVDAKGLVLRLDSAARVIWQYYRGVFDLSKFDAMLAAVDKVDSAKLTAREVLNPEGWTLLGFVMDPRTGLGRFRDFRISNYQLMDMMIDACGRLGIDDILALPDVKERIDLYNEHQKLFTDMLNKHSAAQNNVLVTDLRGVETIYAGNRFLVYSLFPEQNISIWVVDGKNKQNCVIAVGHSIINRTNLNDVGSIMLRYGGGGHRQVGTCQVPYEDADRVISELCDVLQ